MYFSGPFLPRMRLSVMSLFILVALVVPTMIPSVAAAYDPDDKPRISGTREVGRTLTAKLPESFDADSPATYRWFRDGMPISGATEATYVPVTADTGHALWVEMDIQVPVSSYVLVKSDPILISNQSDTTNEIVVLGDNEYGQTILPDNPYSAVAISAGGWHNLALRGNGSVFAWGANGSGQTDVPDGLNDVVAIAAGGWHSMALKSDGTVTGWGSNAVDQSAPPEGLNKVVAIDAGASFSLALKNDGSVVAWGDNSQGQTSVPESLDGVIQVSGGGTHALALKSDGTVIGWGDNTSGQINIPEGLSDVVAISAGSSHSMAVKSDGTVVAWGWNETGQASVPDGLTGAVDVSAGALFSLARKSNGSLVGWGNNDYGPLTGVGEVSGLIDASAGGYHSLLLKYGEPVFADVAIDGEAVEGETVTAVIPDWVEPNAELEYQWFRDGRPIDGATEDSYLVGYADSGHALWVQMTILNTGVGDRAFASDRVLAANLSHTNNQVKGWGSNWNDEASPPANLQNVVSVAAGNSHSLALLADGTVRAWGSGWGGETSIPEGLNNVVAVAAGSQTSFALKSDGTVVSWGWNYRPSLNVPEDLANVVAISTKDEFVVALLEDGTVRTWGSNYGGEGNVPEGLTDVIAVDAGAIHALALKSDGSVVAWGNGPRAQVPADLPEAISIHASSEASIILLADGTVRAFGEGEPTGSNPMNLPTDVSEIDLLDTGNYHVIAQKSDGTLFGWGSSSNDKLEIPDGVSDVMQISAGSNHTLVVQPQTLSGDDAVVSGEPAIGDVLTVEVGQWEVSGVTESYRWFRDGQVIDGETAAQYTITSADRGHAVWAEVTGKKTKFSRVFKSSNLTLVQRGAYEGSVVAWGLDTSSQSTIPASARGVVSIDAGDAHSIGLKDDGTVLAWGENDRDQTLVPEGLDKVVAIAAGDDHNLALRSDGTVVAWGDNSFGQIEVPEDLDSVVAIAAGETVSMALKSNGTIVAWGENDEWHGLTYPPNEARKISAIAAGKDFALALKTDGTVLGWGDDRFDQPYPPEDLDSVTSIAAGDYHALALKSDGTVVAWGSNRDRATEVPDSLDSVVSIAAGGKHSMALKSDGTVVTWGSNRQRQLTQSTGLSDVIAIAAGQYHSMAITTTLKDLATAVPTVSGTTTIGETLTANTGNWTADTEFSYQWFRGNTEISDATSRTYTVTTQDAGSTLKVRVTGSKPGFRDASTQSAATSKILLSAKPTVSGTLSVGSTLTAVRGTWSTGVTFTYQWLRDGSPISKATKDKYTLTSADAGRAIQVQVVGQKDAKKEPGWSNATRRSDASLKVMAAATPKIAGTAKVGQRLTAVPGSWTASTSFNYEWRANGRAIPGATANTLVIPSNVKGQVITVAVTGSRAGFATITLVSAGTKKVS